MSITELLLSLLSYALWFGPLLALVIWAIWKLAHTFHRAVPATEAAPASTRRTPPSSVVPLAHG